MISNEWIKDLKVGDEVLVVQHSKRSIAKVLRITPAGKIVIPCGLGTTKFDSRGWEIGGQVYYQQHLEPCTEEARLSILQSNLAERVKQAKFASLTLDQLKRIMSIINENNQPKEGEK